MYIYIIFKIRHSQGFHVGLAGLLNWVSTLSGIGTFTRWSWCPGWHHCKVADKTTEVGFSDVEHFSRRRTAFWFAFLMCVVWFVLAWFLFCCVLVTFVWFVYLFRLVCFDVLCFVVSPDQAAVTWSPEKTGVCRKQPVEPKELLPMLLLVVRGGTAKSIRHALTFACFSGSSSRYYEIRFVDIKGDLPLTQQQLQIANASNPGGTGILVGGWALLIYVVNNGLHFLTKKSSRFHCLLGFLGRPST